MSQSHNSLQPNNISSQKSIYMLCNMWMKWLKHKNLTKNSKHHIMMQQLTKKFKTIRCNTNYIIVLMWSIFIYYIIVLMIRQSKNYMYVCICILMVSIKKWTLNLTQPLKPNSTPIKPAHRVEVCTHLYTMKSSNL